jgi:acetoin utilization deacetylase AcuC-like enzyme
VEIQGGQATTAYDQVARMDELLGALDGVPGLSRRDPTEHGTGPILAVHDAGLVDFLLTTWATSERSRTPVSDLIFADTFLHPSLAPGPEAEAIGRLGHVAQLGYYCFDTITGIGPGTAAAALGAVDTALTAADEIRTGDHRLAVGLCRPPGHHAGRLVFGGGCYFNNAAIAAQHLRDSDDMKVAILDLDFHHGNGTQEIFYDDPNVLYVSIHGAPERTFPYFTGFTVERGRGAGVGCNMNLPLPPAVGIADYRLHLEKALHAITEFGADVLVLSLGLDASQGDPSGDGALRPDDFWSVGSDVAGACLPTIAVVEGGYRLDTLGASFEQAVRGLLHLSD